MNLSNMILQGARYFPDKEAIVFEDTRFTYRELNDSVDLVAAYLRDRGIKRNDRVALYCENRPEWIMLYYGIIRLGAIVVCVSSAYRSSELEYLLTDSQPACVVTSEKLVDNIPDISKSSQIGDILVIENDGRLANLGLKSKASSETSLATADCDGNDTCVILCPAETRA